MWPWLRRKFVPALPLLTACKSLSYLSAAQLGKRLEVKLESFKGGQKWLLPMLI